MQIKRDFDYYYNLSFVVSNALLHLLCKVSDSSRYVPVSTRNEILVKYLKPKLSDKSLTNIKKDLKLMIGVARTKTGNLEMKLFELNKNAQSIQLDGVERLYNLLAYLKEVHDIESRMFEPGSDAEDGILYLLEDHIEHGFNDDSVQVAPISMLLQSVQAPDVVDMIITHGSFNAEMKEWNSDTNQAHIVIHPISV